MAADGDIRWDGECVEESTARYLDRRSLVAIALDTDGTGFDTPEQGVASVSECIEVRAPR